MRYPDKLKLYLMQPKRKITKIRFDKFKRILDNFGEVLVSHSHHGGSGITYFLNEIHRWDTGEIILHLHRKDDDFIPDNQK